MHLVVGLFWGIPKRYRIWVIAIASAAFYASWNPAYLPLLLLVTAMSWGFGVEFFYDFGKLTWLRLRNLRQAKSLLTAERIWFKCDLYLRFIPPINLWKVCIDLRPFSKYFNEPFSRTLRSPRSNNLEIQNDENSK